MKNTFLILFFLIIATSSCERDDICIDDITPNLIIRFYDNDNPTEFKSINHLNIHYIDFDIDTLITGLDSISIPLSVSNNLTEYTFTINNDDILIANVDTLTINYATEEVIVGRSCGFKSIFNNVDYILNGDDDNWIKNIEIIQDTITNETSAHVKIFH